MLCYYDFYYMIFVYSDIIIGIKVWFNNYYYYNNYLYDDDYGMKLYNSLYPSLEKIRK